MEKQKAMSIEEIQPGLGSVCHKCVSGENKRKNLRNRASDAGWKVRASRNTPISHRTNGASAIHNTLLDKFHRYSDCVPALPVTINITVNSNEDEIDGKMRLW